MCWNIAEGNLTGTLPPNSNLPAIAEQIRAKSPDVVLLNEVKNWDLLIGGGQGDRIRQAKRIAELTGLPYYHWGNTARTGWTGHKAVAVLSRYPLGTPQIYPIMRGNNKTGYAILETTFKINNTVHHVFSTRFDAHNESDNVAAHQLAINLVQKLDRNVSVIFGGDFNANMAEDSQFVEFSQKSGLLNAFFEHPDPLACIKDNDPQTIIDHIFYRGPYKVTQVELRCPWASSTQEVSDHPWLFVQLELLPSDDANSVIVPDVLELSQAKAGQIIRDAGLVPAFTGSSGPGAWVRTQSPKANSLVRPGSTVTLQLRTGPIP
jgi:endonuclease/exonuclease/phosphatase family metal-dependent hydrolase